MLQQLWFYMILGINHVLDWNGYDHVLFLVALALPYTFRQWKSLLLLVSTFTVAHCLSLVLSIYGLVPVNMEFIEFLISVTIFCMAIFTCIVSVKDKYQKGNLRYILTALFGIIHGFGFSNYFKMLVPVKEEQVITLIGFATGIEIAQALIALFMLFLAYVVSTKLNVKKEQYMMGMSIGVLFVTLPMLYKAFPW